MRHALGELHYTLPTLFPSPPAPPSFHPRRRVPSPPPFWQVDRLRHALGELHCTDVNALRRAYRTLCQHVDALDQESAGVFTRLFIRSIIHCTHTEAKRARDQESAGAQLCHAFLSVHRTASKLQKKSLECSAPRSSRQVFCPQLPAQAEAREGGSVLGAAPLRTAHAGPYVGTLHGYCEDSTLAAQGS